MRQSRREEYGGEDAQFIGLGEVMVRRLRTFSLIFRCCASVFFLLFFYFPPFLFILPF